MKRFRGLDKKNVDYKTAPLKNQCSMRRKIRNQWVTIVIRYRDFINGFVVTRRTLSSSDSEKCLL